MCLSVVMCCVLVVGGVVGCVSVGSSLFVVVVIVVCLVGWLVGMKVDSVVVWLILGSVLRCFVVVLVCVSDGVSSVMLLMVVFGEFFSVSSVVIDLLFGFFRCSGLKLKCRNVSSGSVLIMIVSVLIRIGLWW